MSCYKPCMPERHPLNDSDVIASREYRRAGSEEVIHVRLAAPKKRASDGRYECRAEISHNEELWVWPMVGADAFEALLLALSIIETDLGLIVRDDEKAVTWVGGDTPGIGLLKDLVHYLERPAGRPTKP